MEINELIELYGRIVKQVREMITDKKIKTFITPSGRPKFVIVDIEPLKVLSKQTDQKLGLIQNVINFELPQFVKAALGSRGIANDNPNLNLISFPGDDQKLDEKTRKRLTKQKLQIVEDYLITPDIKFSYLIKTTSKGDCLTGVDWEINLKTFDDVEGNLPNLKYATIRFRTVTSKDGPTGFFGDLFGSNESSAAFDCDISDVDYLIEILGSVKKALEKEV